MFKVGIRVERRNSSGDISPLCPCEEACEGPILAVACLWRSAMKVSTAVWLDVLVDPSTTLHGNEVLSAIVDAGYCAVMQRK